MPAVKATPWEPGANAALRILMVAFTAAWPLAASAYRPFDSTDAAVAARGELEIELGPLGYEAQRQDKSLVAPSVVLNWGITEGWKAVLEGSHLVRLGSLNGEPRLRVEDTALSLKGVLREGSLQQKNGPSVATELSALLSSRHGRRRARRPCPLRSRRRRSHARRRA